MKKFFMELLPSWHQPKVMPSRYCYRPRPKIASSFFLNCLDFDSHFELLQFFIFQSGGRLTSYHVTLKRCFCPQTWSIWILDPKCQKWLGFSMLVLLRGRHCILAMSVLFWLICIVSVMFLLLSALTFCNSNPWIQFSGSKFKRFLFEICQRRSNPPWQGSCPGQEPTFPTTGPDVLLLLLLHNISPSKPPQKVFWSLTAQKKLTLGLKPFFPKQKWAKILWTGGGHK